VLYIEFILQIIFTSSEYFINHSIKTLASVAYAENFHGWGFIQWHMAVICIWCALFVRHNLTPWSCFPKQRFGEVCSHNMHIFLHPLALFHVSLHWIWTISAPKWGYRRKINSALRHSSWKLQKYQAKTGE